MTSVEKLVEISKNEVGYLEKATNYQLDDKTANAGSANYTKYARDLDAVGWYNTAKNGYAWCAVFVSWCLQKAFGVESAMEMTNQYYGCLGASCTCMANYYKNNSQFYYSPAIGDQIFFTTDGQSSNHTGIVVAYDANTVWTIEGNTSSATGVVDNGGCVSAKYYSLSYSKILGYGRPNYKLVDEEEEEVTYEQFKAFMTQYLTEVQELPNNEYSQEALDWMKSKGYMQGNANGNMMPQSNLTREQYATVEYRKAQDEGTL